MIALPPQPDLDLASLVRTIPDFPKPGIQFRDITTLIGDAAGFAESVRRLSARAAVHRPDLIVAVQIEEGTPTVARVGHLEMPVMSFELFRRIATGAI